MKIQAPILLVVLLAGAACGGAGEERQAEPPAQPPASAASAAEDRERPGCELMTAAEVSAAVGSEAGDGEDHSLRGCRWTAKSGTIVSLEIFPPGKASCDGQEFLVSGKEERVAGLGDSALWGSSGDLVVCSAKGVINLDFDNSPADPRRDKEALEAMAKIVLARL
jgi:hypothetical protein